MGKEIRSIIYSGVIGIGISFMFMLSIEGFPHTITPFITYSIFGLAAGVFISFSYIVKAGKRRVYTRGRSGFSVRQQIKSRWPAIS